MTSAVPSTAENPPSHHAQRGTRANSDAAAGSKPPLAAGSWNAGSWNTGGTSGTSGVTVGAGGAGTGGQDELAGTTEPSGHVRVTGVVRRQCVEL